MRASIDVLPGETTIQLCDLTPGQHYTVIALGAAFGQLAGFEIAPSPAMKKATRDLSILQGKKHAVGFTALSECVEIPVRARSAQQVTSIPMSLSVKCESCPDNDAWTEKFISQMELANLSVMGSVSAQSLITNTLVGGNCFQVGNVSSSGNGSSRGSFTSGATNIGLSSGIALCTGPVTILPGPNNSQSANGGYNTNSADDPDLATLTSGNQFDRSAIEFDFTPTASTVQFDFVFGSEEYCEFVGSQYNDVFGFFISGPGISGNQNLATLPGGGTPVSVNTVNHQTNNDYYINNNNGGINCPFLPPVALTECQLDGWTTVLTATANLIPCSTYHIKLVIADIGDASWSSAVFLRANSFDAGGTVNAQPVYGNNLPVAYEACNTAFIKFSRGNADNSQPLVINYSVDTAASTATKNLDFILGSGPTVTIPAGQNEILVPVIVLDDLLTEGQETIVFKIDNACSCTQQQVTMLLQDTPPFSISLEDQAVCSGAAVTLAPNLSGGIGPFAYFWNTGPLTPSLVVDQAGIYSVRVIDECGRSRIDSAQVQVDSAIQLLENVTFCPGDSVVINGLAYYGPATVADTLAGVNGCDTIITYLLTLLPQPTVNDTILFCPGGSVTIGGTVYTGSAVVTETIPGQGADCDTLATYVLQLLPQPAFTDTISICPGSSVTIGGTVYNQAATVVDTIPGVNGDCDTIATYVLEIGQQVSLTENISFCPGASVTINGTVYNAAGTVLDTLPGANGACDTLLTYKLDLLPQPLRSESISLCPGAQLTIGGTAYSAPGTVLDTIPGTNGACDTIVTYTLILLPQPVRAETLSFCPGETVTIGGTTYNAPGIVLNTVPGTNGACDTIVTYTLKFLTPAPSTVNISCPANIGVTLTGAGGSVVNYNAPQANSNCPCPGLTVELTAGLSSGSTFSTGSTQVCYTATDACGNSAACCFKVEVSETPPCDIKEIRCLKFELLSITKNPAEEKTYRIRVTNNCNSRMVYAAFQLPFGLTAVSPPDNSIYTAASGRTYLVRNPNYSPFYSIRFKSKSDSIVGGESDIFEYTLPPQADPDYIHGFATLEYGVSFEVHLNTFYCPVGVTPGMMREAPSTGGLRIFPNPTSGTLFADLSSRLGEQVLMQVFDATGRRVLHLNATAASDAQEIPLPKNLANGLYALEVLTADGQKQVLRFVVQR